MCMTRKDSKGSALPPESIERQTGANARVVIGGTAVATSITSAMNSSSLRFSQQKWALDRS